MKTLRMKHAQFKVDTFDVIMVNVLMVAIDNRFWVDCKNSWMLQNTQMTLQLILDITFSS